MRAIASVFLGLALALWLCPLASSEETEPVRSSDVQYEAVYKALGFANPASQSIVPIGPDAIEANLATLEALAGEGHAASANLLGTIYKSGLPDTVEPDPARARALFEAAIETENPEVHPIACLNLAGLLAETAAAKDPVWLRIRTLAECGRETESLFAAAGKPLALSYIFAADYEDKISEARPLLEAVIADNPTEGHAAFVLAKGLEHAWFGGPSEPEAACAAYETASDAGDVRAHWHAGMCYLNGTGVEADEEQAFQRVVQSARANQLNGLISAAVMLATGQGVGLDPSSAAQFYEQAIRVAPGGRIGKSTCLAGTWGSACNERYDPEKPIDGLCAFKLASAGGDGPAQDMINRIGDLTADQLQTIAEEEARLKVLYSIE